MPAKSSKRSKRPTQKNPSLVHFQELERKSQEKTYDGEMVQFYVLEWLRIESLALADLNPQEQQYHQHDLACAKAGQHRWLIGCGPRPKGIALPGLPMFARRGFAVFPLPLGKPSLDPNRVTLSIDPLQPWAEVLMPKIERHVSGAKERMFHRKRARGGGRPHPLAKMWEALQLYAKRQQDAKRAQSKAQTKTPIKCLVQGGRSEDYGKKLLIIAKRMIKAAQAGPTAWHTAFPVR